MSIMQMRRRRRHLAFLSIVVAAASLGLGASAADAKTVTLNSSASLRMTASHGNKIEAKGTISGTFAGSLAIQVSIVSGSRMTATFVGNSRHGELVGSVSAGFYPSGSVTLYTGSGGISRGTSAYAHAHASGLHVQGELDRAHHLITLHISGHLSE